mgnify:CR=1 FL=1
MDTPITAKALPDALIERFSAIVGAANALTEACLLYTSPSPRD